MCAAIFAESRSAGSRVLRELGTKQEVRSYENKPVIFIRILKSMSPWQQFWRSAAGCDTDHSAPKTARPADSGASPAGQAKQQAGSPAKSGFSFAVYGDSRSMMYLPYKADQKEEATKLLADMFELVLPEKIAEEVVRKMSSYLRRHGKLIEAYAVS